MPDVPISAQDRRRRLRREAAASRAEAWQLADSFDESTALSWFWALLFGPLYYLVHGFYARALVVLVLYLMGIGVLVSPFLAYPAWRKRALGRAEVMLRVDRGGHPMGRVLYPGRAPA
ncbi:DUF2628 domain-containing protein [Sinirhodobacter huangdaonensis]|uniref:DUF2628 domain-containing protein n=1 Tax=Paenirhodobacter huangdaonensis TaxID=2501515 RepID=A0A3S3LE90_9RHOB|nr:DUF2628 domain-containing protein [Sinirhodobacter huangdaonensis]RWR53408.1 DUF2628 domain-containing protein [Sinirhodobacter huangdaonensis]